MSVVPWFRQSVCTNLFCFFLNSLIMDTAEEATASDILVIRAAAHHVLGSCAFLASSDDGRQQRVEA